MRKWSAVQVRFALTNKCPVCGSTVTSAHYFKSDGTRTRMPILQRQQVTAQCPKCKGQWLYFSDLPATSKVQAVGVLDVVETDRIEEPLGDEIRTIDNYRSGITVARTLTATKDWMQTYTIQAEQAKVTGKSAELGAKDLGVVRADAEETLRRKYQFSKEIRQTFTEEITLTIPARTKVHLVLHWKRIWQRGFVRLERSPDQVIDVPFKMVIGVTFDQSQADEP
jgi:hypothetical protein